MTRRYPVKKVPIIAAVGVCIWAGVAFARGGGHGGGMHGGGERGGDFADRRSNVEPGPVRHYDPNHPNPNFHRPDRTYNQTNNYSYSANVDGPYRGWGAPLIPVVVAGGGGGDDGDNTVVIEQQSAPQEPPAQAAAPSAGAETKLTELGSMRDKGLITQSEYDAEKKAVLDRFAAE